MAKKKSSTDDEIKLFLDYEIRGSLLPRYISWKWLQELVASYYLRKTMRKYKRFCESKNYELDVKVIIKE